jgi:hypothetical protein
MHRCGDEHQTSGQPAGARAVAPRPVRSGVDGRDDFRVGAGPRGRIATRGI